MNNNCNKKVYKAIDKTGNKHKQQANTESIFAQIIKTTGNESLSKVFHQDRIEALVTDMLENKPQLEEKSPYLTEKSSY